MYDCKSKCESEIVFTLINPCIFYTEWTVKLLLILCSHIMKVYIASKAISVHMYTISNTVDGK